MDAADIDHKPPGQKKIYNMYALFGVALGLGFLPSIAAALVSLLFFIAVLIYAYVLRSGAEDESLLENHSTYVIRTIWIASFFMIVTMIIGSVYLVANIDYASFDACAQSAAAGLNMADIESSSLTAVYGYMTPCMDGFISDNLRVLIVSLFLAGGLPIIYIIYRFFKGLARAIKGYRLANVKGWF